MAVTEDRVDEKIEFQYVTCQKNYYKVILRTVIASVTSVTIILMGIIGWSYRPISDIAVLKKEVKIMHEKLDVVIKKDKPKTQKTAENDSDQETKAIQVSAQDLAAPALGAVCKRK